MLFQRPRLSSAEAWVICAIRKVRFRGSAGTMLGAVFNSRQSVRIADSICPRLPGSRSGSASSRATTSANVTTGTGSEASSAGSRETPTPSITPSLGHKWTYGDNC